MLQKWKKRISFFLAVALVLGLLPTGMMPAKAVESAGASLPGTTGSSVSHGTWKCPTGTNTFVRFTLIELPKGVLSNEGGMTNYNVVGKSVNVYNLDGQGTSVNMDNVKWTDTNAMKYLVEGASIIENDTIQGSELKEDRKLFSRDEIKNSNLAFQSLSEGQLRSMFWPGHGEWGNAQYWPNGNFGDPWLTSKDVQTDNGVGLYEGTDQFKALLGILTENDSEWNMLEPDQKFDKFVNGVSENGGARYRLIAETGQLWHHESSNSFWALTYRDMAAYAIIAEHGNYSSDAYLAYNRTMFMNRGNELYLKAGQFAEYMTDAEGNFVAGSREVPPEPNYFHAGNPPTGTPTMSEHMDILRDVMNLQADNKQNDSTKFRGLGLGVIGPEGFQKATGLTVVKTMAGDYDPVLMATTSWEFRLKYTGAVKPDPSQVRAIDAKGNPITNTLNFNSDGFDFQVKSNSRVSISFNVSGSVDYEVSEIDAKVPDYTQTIQGPGGTDQTDSGVATGSLTMGESQTVTFTNTPKDPATPVNPTEAHLIIDYNLTTSAGGLSATDDTLVTIVSDTQVDCGKHKVGDDVSANLTMNGTLLEEGETITVISGTMNQVNYTVTATFQGLYTQATGGTKVDFPYKLTHSGLTVLYGQWTYNVTANYTGSTTTTPVVVGDGGVPPTTPYNIYTVFWDYNYVNGGVTSSQVGEFSEWVITNTHTYYSGGGSSHTTEYDRNMRVSFVAAAPTPGNRDGYKFLGWSTTPTTSNWNGKFYDQLTSNVATSPSASEILSVAMGSKKTFYAQWVPEPSNYWAMGGKWNQSSLVTNSVKKETYKGSGTYGEQVEIQTAVNANIATQHISSEPTREGYTFSGWYFDPNCSIPANYGDEGVIPGRNYFASWTPEKVYVNYYDNRQGTPLIETQVYDYEDSLDLAAGIPSTTGWTFTGWQYANIATNGNITANGVSAQDGGKMAKGFGNMTYHPAQYNASGVLTAAGYWTIDIVATWNEVTTSYTVTIDWDDYNNNDGVRPQNIIIGLKSSVGNSVIATKEITGSGNQWTHTFTGLPVTTSNSSTEKVSYSYVILGYTDAHGTSYTYNDSETGTGELRGLTTTNMSTDPITTYSFSTRRFSLLSAGANPTNTVSAYSGTLYLNHDLITTGEDIKFTITWDDDHDNDGLRPSSVNLTLYDGNGAAVTNSSTDVANSGTVTINSGDCEISDDGNSWTYTFRDYQKYKNNGTLILYKVGVTYNVPGYTKTYLHGMTDRDEDSVILSHTNSTKNLPFFVVWKDDANRDGVRPSEVTVTLTARQYNNYTNTWEIFDVDAQTINGASTDAQWQGVFSNKEVNHGGEPVYYTYSITSNLNADIQPGISGYTWDASTNTLTVRHSIQLRDVPVVVEWDDHDNQDGVRPTSVVIKLRANNTALNEAEYNYVLAGDPNSNTWEYTFHNVPKYQSGYQGREILYTIVAGETVENSIFGVYTEHFRDSSDNDTTLLSQSAYAYERLAHVNQTGNQPFTVIWHDGSNRDNVRPDAVTIGIFATRLADNGSEETVAVGSKSVTGTSDTWTGTFDNLETNHNGAPVQYSFQVTSNVNANIDTENGVNGYTWDVDGNTIHLRHVAQLTSIPVTVEWNDENNHDGIRPASVIVRLYADGTHLEDTAYNYELTGDADENIWTHTFYNLPKYKDGQKGKEILYTIYVDEVSENSLFGQYTLNGEAKYRYTEAYRSSTGATTAALNESAYAYARLTHANDFQELPFTVIWQDQNNRDGVRPDSVLVKLEAWKWNSNNSQREKIDVATKTLSGDSTANAWTGTFGANEIYHGSEPVYYVMTVLDNSNLEPVSEINGYWFVSNSHEATIYAHHATQLTDVPAVVEWADNQNNDGIRPSAVVVHLRANEESYATDPDLMSLLEQAQYHFVLTGDATANTWEHTFTGLPKYKLGSVGEEILYTIVVDEYSTSDLLFGTYQIQDNNGIAQTKNRYAPNFRKADGTFSAVAEDSKFAYEKLTHTTDVSDLDFTIVWRDDQNRDGVRPNEVVVTLTAQAWSETAGQWVAIDTATQTVSASNFLVGGLNKADQWTGTFLANEISHDGANVKYVFSVTSEVNAFLNDGQSGYTSDSDNSTIYMRHATQLVDVPVVVEWDDNQNNDGIRPYAVVVHLCANEESNTTDPELMNLLRQAQYNFVLTGDATANTWEHTFTGLPKYKRGSISEEILYTIVVDEYSTSDLLFGTYQVTDNNGMAQTKNRYAPSFRKADGTFSVNAVDSRYAYEKLTHNTDASELPFTIVWNDQHNRDGIRPDGVTVTLTARKWNASTSSWDETVVATKTVTVDAVNASTADTWTGSFGMNEISHDGENVYYSFSITSNLDAKVYDGETGYTWDADNSTLYVNHAVQLIDVPVVVEWDDNGNNDGLRPASVVVHLRANNETTDVGLAQLLDDAQYHFVVTGDSTENTWTHTFTGLPRYRLGSEREEILYTIEVGEATENSLFGDYTTTDGTGNTTTRHRYTGYFRQNDGTLVTDASLSAYAYERLSHVNETDSQPFTVIWHDGSNRDNVRPDAVTIGLFVTRTTGNGTEETVALESMSVSDTSDVWTGVFNNQEIAHNGVSTRYSFKVISDVNASIDIENGQNGYTWDVDGNTIHLYHVAQLTSVPVTIEWNDEHNHDGIRPASVIVRLYADGVHLEDAAYNYELTGDVTQSVWTYTFYNLQKYKEGQKGKEILYTIYVDEVSEDSLFGQYTLNSETKYRYTESYRSSTGATTTVLDESAYAYARLTHANDFKELPFTIVWQDQNNRDGVRPDSVIVKLDAWKWNNTTSQRESIEVARKTLTGGSTENTWTGTFGENEIYHGSEPVYYELTVLDNSNSEPSSEINGYWFVSNSHETTVYAHHSTQLVDVPVVVEWDDNQNNDGIRPSAVVVHLRANEESSATDPDLMDLLDQAQYHFVLTGDANANTWEHTFTGLPKYKLGSVGKEILYTIVVDEYSTSDLLFGTYQIQDNNGVTQTRERYAPNFRKADGTFSAVAEDSRYAYEKLTHTTDVSDLDFAVIWRDNQNRDGVRPNEVTVTLTAQKWNEITGQWVAIDTATKTLSANDFLVGGQNTADQWTGTFLANEISHDGENVKYVFSITSEVNAFLNNAQNGYTSDSDNNVIYVRHATQLVDVPAVVEWDDDNNNDGIRPSAVVVHLHAYEESNATDPDLMDLLNQAQYHFVLTGDANADTWEHVFTGLPKYKLGSVGKEILYTITVDEYSTSDLLFGTYQIQDNNGITQTRNRYAPNFRKADGTFSAVAEDSRYAYEKLTHNTDVSDLDFTIVWRDDQNRDGVRPNEVIVTLTAQKWNATSGRWITIDTTTKTLSASDFLVGGQNTADQWTGTFLANEISHDGENVKYIFSITSEMNAFLNNGQNGYTSDADNNVIYVRHATQLIDVPVTVEWDDNSNNDGIRPAFIVVHLKANDPTLDALLQQAQYNVVLSGDATASVWNYTFQGVPQFKAGSVAEEVLYTIFVDEATADTLFGQYTTTDSQGVQFTNNRYSASYRTAAGTFSDNFGDSAYAYEKLTHSTDISELPFTIVWDDQNNRDGIRPNEVTVTLNARNWNTSTARWDDPIPVATKTVSVDATNTSTANTWSGSFGMNEIAHDGTAVYYSYSITSDLNANIHSGEIGYTWNADNNTLYVHHATQLVDVPVVIEWDDDHDHDGIRPSVVVVHLHANEESGDADLMALLEQAQYHSVLTGDATANTWEHAFEGLPKYKRGSVGEEILYTITVDEYASSDLLFGTYQVVDNNGTALVKNRYTPSFRKTDGTFSAVATDSKYAYEKLTHNPDVSDLSFTVVWRDEQNRDGVRPDEVVVTLTAQKWNETTGQWITIETATQTLSASNFLVGGLNKADQWTGTFPANEIAYDGEAVKYSFSITSEVNAFLNDGQNGYTSDADNNIIYVRHATQTRTVPITVEWDDDRNNDGIRPSAVVVHLHANEESGATDPALMALLEQAQYHFVLTGDATADTWEHTFAGLPKYKLGSVGEEILYTITVDEYSTSELLFGTYQIQDNNGVTQTRNRYTPNFRKADGTFSTAAMDSRYAYEKLIHSTDVSDLDFTIIWRDDQNRDGVRPNEVVVTLTAQKWNQTTGQWITIDTTTKTLSASDFLVGGQNTADQWTGTFLANEISHDGENVKYTFSITSEMNAFLNNGQTGYTSDSDNNIIYVRHATQTKSVPVTVEWDDDGNNDGIRPAFIVVHLKSNDPTLDDLLRQARYNVVLNGDATASVWNYTFEGVPQFKAGSVAEEVLYTIFVDEVTADTLFGQYTTTDSQGNQFVNNRYAASYRTAAGTFSDSFNDSAYAYEKLSHSVDTSELPFTIVWDDQNNRDGIRPNEVTVTLTARTWNTATNGWDETVVATKTISVDATHTTTADTWAGSFGLNEIAHGGEAVYYSYSITSNLDALLHDGETGYTWSADNNTLYVHHAVQLVDVPAVIEWDDSNNNDAIRPAFIVVHLRANNEAGDTALAQLLTDAQYHYIVAGNSTEDTWTHTFTGLPRYRLGAEREEILYTIEVDEATADSLFGDYDVTDNNGITTTRHRYTGYFRKADGTFTTNAVQSAYAYERLSHDTQTENLPFTIIWKDQNNRDGVRPENVTITLSARHWNNHTYRWEEVDVSTKTVSSEDFLDANGKNTLDIWTGTFGAHEIYHGSGPVYYTFSVTSDVNAFLNDGVNGYIWDVDDVDNSTAGGILTLKHATQLIDIPVTVEWDDDGNNDQIRPTSIVVRLKADIGNPNGQDTDLNELLNDAQYNYVLTGSATGDTWTHTFVNVPRYRLGEVGQEILYTIVVDEADEDSLWGTYVVMANGERQRLHRYAASFIDANNQTTTDETQSAFAFERLSHDSDQGTIVIYASWHDDNNRDGKRPTSVQADLYKQIDGVRTLLETITLAPGADSTWSITKTNMPLRENGKEVTYFVDVSSDNREQMLNSNGYTVSTQGTVVHLYYSNEIGFVTTNVVWSDNDNNDNIRPNSLDVTLYANGIATNQVLSLNPENNWTVTWHDLTTYFANNNGNGQKIQYSVEITTPDGYTATYTPASVSTLDEQNIVIELTHVASVIDVPVTIHWADNDNNTGTRPASVNIQLYANGDKVVGKTADVTGDGNTWTYTFTDLPAYKDGAPIYYTAKINDSTTNTYSELTAGCNVYLSQNMPTANMYVSFVFDDAQNADGLRPDGLYLTLTADGVKVNDADYQHTMNFDIDGVKWTFYNLPVFSAVGTKISYNATIEFAPSLGGLDEQGNSIYTISNTRDVELSTTNSNANQIVVKLSKTTDTGTETGHIYWFDANNRRGNRPTSIDIIVRSDAANNVIGAYKIDSVTGLVTDQTGNPVGTVTVSEWGTGNDASCWTYTIDGLVQNAVYNTGSNEVYYWALARATGIANWYTVLDGEANGLDVNLTHKDYSTDVGASTRDYSVTVNWLDNSDAWGYRPDTAGVTITISANGTAYRSILLTKDNKLENNDNVWSYTFTGLPTYLNGSAVVWSATIEDVNKYDATTSHYADYSVFKMTQVIGFNFTAYWEDSNNDDAKRPGNITVDVYGDGTKLADVTLTGTGNVYTGSVEDLPVWRETGTDTPVSYSFRWSTATNATLTDNYYSAAPTKDGQPQDGCQTFYFLSATSWGDKSDAGFDNLAGTYEWETTLTRNKETRDVFGEILWDDDGNRDGVRPDGVYVALFANGVAVGDPVYITGSSTESSWPMAWRGVDVYQNGQPIVYTIAIAGTPTGYTKTPDATETQFTMTHAPARIDVTGQVSWMDNTELHYVYDEGGNLIHTYAQIARKDIYIQLLANGEALGDPVFVPASGYGTGENLMGYVQTTWPNLYQYENEGSAIVYTFSVYSDALTVALANGRHSITYNFDTTTNTYYNGNDLNAPLAVITRDLFDVTGKVYYLYDTDDSFLLPNVRVTAYLYNGVNQTYSAVGSAVTGPDGTFKIENVPQGTLTIRATYQYGDYTYAGTQPLQLDRHDGDVTIIVNRDSTVDSDLYRYTAQGNAYYQTDVQDASTIHPVPKDSIVLLYEINNGYNKAVYYGMTSTDENGHYAFSDLPSGKYVVNVIFNYDRATYTYDNSDAVRDGLAFPVFGGDIVWPDIVKQVNNNSGTVNPAPGQEVDPTPAPTPIPCVVSGKVFYSDYGTHTTDPVADVDVYIYAANNNAELAHVVTDAAGNWSVEGLGVGDYIAVFSLEGYASRVLRFTITSDIFTAGTYTAQTQYFERVSVGETATIHGVVLDDAGNRVNAMVLILDENDALVDVVYTDGNGYYSSTVVATRSYKVKILGVDIATANVSAGNPDDNGTSVAYYLLSGNYSINNVPQSGASIAVFSETETYEFVLVTGTTTEADGGYAVKVFNPGNYKVVYYLNGQVYEEHLVSVGYEPTEAKITNVGTSFTISGSEAHDTLKLYDITTNVVTLVEEQGAGTDYSISGLSAGVYDLVLTTSGTDRHYYLDSTSKAVSQAYYINIFGQIVDQSGDPVLGATVRLLDANGDQVGNEVILTTGNYSFDNIPSGTYTVQVVSPVAATEFVNRTTKDGDSYGIAYPYGMTPGGYWTLNINALNATGKVVDQNGNPIANAVVVFRDNDNPSRAYGSMTNANGVYYIGVMPGNYTVEAMFEVDANHIYHSTDTKTVQVSNNNTTVPDLTIVQYQVNFRVERQADGKPLSDAVVMVQYSDGRVVNIVTTDATGATETIAMMPDSYKINVNYGTLYVDKPVTISQDQTVVITVDEAVTISGNVKDQNGAAITDAIITYDGPDSGVAYTDNNGHYVINIDPTKLGRYSLIVHVAGMASDPVYVTVSTDTTLDLTVNVPEPAANQYVLSGVVTDNNGNRLPNAIVWLTIGNDKVNGTFTSTNNNGEYRFVVEDGTYYLEASYTDFANFVYDTNAETVVHVNGADKTQNLVVTMLYNVTIHVVDTNGAAVNGATISYDGTSDGTITTGADGTVTISVPGGDYSFNVRCGNRAAGPFATSIDKTTDITFTINTPDLAENVPSIDSDTLTIQGHVLDPQNAPVEGAVVVLKKFDVATETWIQVDSTTSDADGYYKFSSLASGKYTVEISYTQNGTAVSTVYQQGITGYALDDSGNPYVGATVYLVEDDTAIIEIVRTNDSGYYEFTNVAPSNSGYTVRIVPVNGETAPIIVNNPAVVPTVVLVEGVVVDVNGNPVEGATVTITDENQGQRTMTTDATGAYRFEVPAGNYTISIQYPANYTVVTNNYTHDDSDPNSPDLKNDNITLAGIVKDTDGNTVSGAVVILLDETEAEVARTTTDAEGKYSFTGLTSGIYFVRVEWNNKHVTYEVNTEDKTVSVVSDPTTEQLTFSGVVVTNHNRPISGATVTITDENSSAVVGTITTDADGRFAKTALERGRYKFIAQYTHDKGTNVSDPTFLSASANDVVLVIVLCYETDLDGDGTMETVYAGADDTFGTPDDYYMTDVNGDGTEEKVFAGQDSTFLTSDDYYLLVINGVTRPVFAGEDKTFTTPDDFYTADRDNDGTPDVIYIGADKIPGTADDNYTINVNNVTITVYIGTDKTPGTTDDWYTGTIDGNDTPVYSGDDAKPGTKDDTYQKDVDGNGTTDDVHIGTDTNPDTKKDYIEVDGKPVYINVKVTFDAQSGTVNNGATYTELAYKVASLPTATRSGYSFNQWYTAPTGGTKIDLAFVQSLTADTTVYAHWISNSSGGGGGGYSGGGGSSGGGGGGGGGGGSYSPLTHTVKFDSNGGTAVPDQTVADNGTATRPEKVTHTGYSLIGWYTAEGKEYDFATKVTKDITLTAKWIPVLSELLNTTDHIAYIQGNEKGLSMPYAQITRAEVAMIFYRLLNDKVRNEYKTPLNSFTDVDDDAWYTVAISTLSKMGIVKGRGDNTFDPNAAISRAEFAVIASRFDGMSAGKKSFTDVPATHWACIEISSAATKGWVLGYTDGSFHPDAAILRCEAITLINRVLGRDKLTLDSMHLPGMIEWVDNSDVTAWYYLAIQEATNGHKSNMSDDLETWTELTATHVSNQ